MQNSLLVITHGAFAQALLSTAEMIFGEQKNISSLTLMPGMQIEDFRLKIEDYIVKHENDNILILVDLLSLYLSFNSVIPQYKQNERIYVVTGVNLPMLLEVGMQKDKIGFEELCSLAKTSGIAGIVTKDDILKGSE